MADILDDAEKATEMFHKEAMTKRREEGPSATGSCLYCEEPFTDDTQRFCDAYCRDSWESEEALRNRG